MKIKTMEGGSAGVIIIIFLIIAVAVGGGIYLMSGKREGKGGGEGGILPVASAIANAIDDAVGVRITELPITPEKILSALDKEEFNI